MSGWILVGCCAGLVAIGLYLLLTAPPISRESFSFQTRCAGGCEHCGRADDDDVAILTIDRGRICRPERDLW